MKTSQVLFRYALCAWLAYAIYWSVTATDRTILERTFFPAFVVLLLVLNELQLRRIKKLEREAQKNSAPTLGNDVYHDYRETR